jgi:hypothetical protein
LLNCGLLHEGLFFETSGEFFGVWEALKPAVPTFRELFVNKQILVHLEEAAKRYEAWSEHRNPVISPRCGNSCNRCAVR